jgi:cell division septation protein DedD
VDPPLAAPKAPEEPPPQRAGPTWRVRVAVFVGPKQSGRLAERLEEMGYPVRYEELSREGGGKLYIVSVSPLPTEERAREVKAEMKERLGVEAMVKQN